jgi:hypothetical protein
MKARLPWFRMHCEFVDDPKVQRLDGDTFKFWVNCLGLAGQNNGILPSVHDIAWKMKLKEPRVSAMVAKLHEANLLDREGETFAPHNWQIRQYKSDVSTDRVRRFRNGNETFPKRPETQSETAPDTETDTEAEKKQHDAPNGACTEEPADAATADNRGLVRSIASAKRPRRSAKRSTEEIRKALGERLSWWEAFWAEFPCHDAINEAINAYERKITTRELAEKAWRGAKAYRAKVEADPTTRLKFGQGWINSERWTDESPPRPSPGRTPTANEIRRAETIRGMELFEQLREAENVR